MRHAALQKNTQASIPGNTGADERTFKRLKNKNKMNNRNDLAKKLRPNATIVRTNNRQPRGSGFYIGSWLYAYVQSAPGAYTRGGAGGFDPPRYPIIWNAKKKQLRRFFAFFPTRHPNKRPPPPPRNEKFLSTTLNIVRTISRLFNLRLPQHTDDAFTVHRAAYIDVRRATGDRRRTGCGDSAARGTREQGGGGVRRGIRALRVQLV